jgi:hypothetical protein
MTDKLRLLFIVPCHENNECLLDTISNIKKFNSNDEVFICIKINTTFEDFNPELFLLENVVTFSDKFGNHAKKHGSQFMSIINSYKFAKSQFGEFDYVTIFHTSQLFIKHGYSTYIRDFDTSFKEEKRFPFNYNLFKKPDENLYTTFNKIDAIGRHTPLDWHLNFNLLTVEDIKQKLFDFYNDKFPYPCSPIIEMHVFKNIFNDVTDLNNYYYQGVEESFYTGEIFEYIISCVDNLLYFEIDVVIMESFFGFTPIEEIIIPTLAIHKAKRIGKNTIHWLNIPDCQISIDECYSIKHVNRDYNDPLRVKIRENKTF